MIMHFAVIFVTAQLLHLNLENIFLIPEIPSGDTILYKRMVFLEILAKYLEILKILEIRIS